MRNRKGFTLVEIMVVVSVTAMLSAVILVYNSSTREQIVLSTEKVKLTQVVLRSKSLAISTYSDASVPCGYGMYIDPAARTYTLMRYAPADCSVTDRVDPDPAARQAVSPSEVFTLPPGLVFGNASSSLRYVVFIPPDPFVLIADRDGNLLPTPTGEVILQSADGKYSSTITVNTAGQVTF